MSFTPASEWKKAVQLTLQDVELPSGHTCQVKAVGMETLIKKGMIPNDLLGIIQKALDNNQGKKNEALKKLEQQKLLDELLEDRAKLSAVFDLADVITVECVVQPKVLPAPEHSENRDPELLYVDEVDMEDKMFIFNFVVGGTKKVGEFREELASTVGNTSNRKPVVKATKRTGGTAKRSARR